MAKRKTPQTPIPHLLRQSQKSQTPKQFPNPLESRRLQSRSAIRAPSARAFFVGALLAVYPERSRKPPSTNASSRSSKYLRLFETAADCPNNLIPSLSFGRPLSCYSSVIHERSGYLVPCHSSDKECLQPLSVWLG